MAERKTPIERMTGAEYFAREEFSPVRNELVDGYLYAMTGGGDHHSEIIINLASQIRPALRGGSCRVHAQDLKLQLGPATFYYPDVMVSCDPADNARLFRTSPCLIAEVLSPSTESIDRREKLLAYQSIQSLDAYLISIRIGGWWSTTGATAVASGAARR